MVVDTPGMIDSPLQTDLKNRQVVTERGHPNERGRGSAIDRGYDFGGVVKWYAERADVILLFFDPDKPGTTGETLSILTNSLQGKLGVRAWVCDRR